ncbi:MAG: hypothetical protein GY810_13200 [Aureispira sp.]|nr:hypothetical protein [Aureispira sp.]
MKTLVFLTFLLIGTQLSSFAQADPTKWTFSVEKIAETENEYNVVFDVVLEPEWCIYAQELESEDGPIATSFNFEKADGLELLGKVEEVGDKIEGFDSMFEMNIAKYKKHVKFVQKVKIKSASTLKGYVTFMTCDNHQCLPPTDIDFAIKVE